MTLHDSGDWSVIVPSWDRGVDSDVGALLSLPGDRLVTGTAAGLSELAIYGLISGSGDDDYTFDVLVDDQE